MLHGGRQRRGRLAAAISGSVAALLLLAPAGAGADVTIGSDLAAPANMNVANCPALTGCTYYQANLVDPVTVSPIDGNVVRWRLKAGSVGGTVKLRVLRRNEFEYTAVASSATEIVASNITTYTANIPIKAGDILALDNDSSGIFFSDQSESVSAPLVQIFRPVLAEGETRATDDQSVLLELLMNADIAPPGGSTGPPLPPGTPVLGKLKLSPTTFRAAPSGASTAKKKPPIGTTVSYVSSIAANVTFTTERAASGRKQGKTCKKAGKKAGKKAKGKRCTLYVPVSGSFKQAAKPGANKLKFTGRIKKRKLVPGGYRLVATPTAGSKKGKALRASFRVR